MPPAVRAFACPGKHGRARARHPVVVRLHHVRGRLPECANRPSPLAACARLPAARREKTGRGVPRLVLDVERERRVRALKVEDDADVNDGDHNDMLMRCMPEVHPPREADSRSASACLLALASLPHLLR